MKRLIVMLCMVFTNLSIAKPEALVINNMYLTMVEYPPYLTSEKGEHRGLIVDVLSEALKTQGVRLDLRLTSYPRAVREAVEGRSDGTISNLVYLTDEQKKQLYHKSRYITFMEALLFKKSRFPDAPEGYHANKEYFDGKRVDVVLDTNMHVDESRVKFATNRRMVSMLDKLKLDRTDFAIVTYLNVVDYFNKNEINFTDYGHTKVNTSGSYALFSKKRKYYKEKADILEQGIWKILENGTYQKLVKHYYGDVEPPYDVWPTTKKFVKGQLL